MKKIGLFLCCRFWYQQQQVANQKLLESADIILQKPIWEKIRLIKKYNTCAELKVYVLELVASCEEEKSCHTAVFELEVNDDGSFPSASKGQEGMIQI